MCIRDRIIEKYSKTSHAQEDYIFPILDRSEHKTAQQIFNRTHKVLRKVNRELKTLGEQIGMEMPLTTYVARHTFATVLKRDVYKRQIVGYPYNRFRLPKQPKTREFTVYLQALTRKPQR